MEDPAAPRLENETASPPAAAARPASRRRLLESLFATTLGGALGYHAHPWLLGDKQDETVAAVNSFLERMRERLEAPPRRRTRQSVTAAERPAPHPVELDGTGRDYQTFLDSLGLRYIRPMEMIRPHFNMRGTVSNSLPPRDAWKNIAPTLRVADELRQRLGARLTVLSAYRSPAYNAVCPGAASQSFHLRNMALDLAFDCAPAEVAKAAETLRDQGFFCGGIGRYSTFTHIDTRGYKADWG